MRTTGQLREEIMAKSLTDLDFRQRLLDDPVAVLRDDIGVNLPDGFKLHIHEDNGVDAAHIVLPPAAELSEEQMAQVAAGNCDGTGEYKWDC